MKKAFLWIGIILLSPILLFLILTLLLYLPPVQNWAVDKVAATASESTGMDITVDHVSLKFPLDLSIEGVLVIKQQDTIADIKQVIADVQLTPLFEMRVVVDELELNQANINTIDLISDLQLKGSVGKLSVHSRDINLKKETIELNGALLSDADLTILMSDTAAVDTTTSEPLFWKIHLDSLSLLRSRIDLHMPGDSMRVQAYLGLARASEGNFDIGLGLYTIKNLIVREGSVYYDLPFEAPVQKGIDYNHIALSGVRLGIDSIYFRAPDLALKISEAMLSEKSGLAITRLSGTILMDSTSLRLPKLLLQTPYSNIQAMAAMDFNVMDSVNPGQLHTNLNASLGKQDLLLFMADMPDRFLNRWPEWPLSLQGKIDGNMQEANIEYFEMSLPTAFRASAHGKVGFPPSKNSAGATDLENLMAQLDLSAETYDLAFATTMLDPQLMKDYRIPKGIKVNGSVGARGSRYMADLIASEGGGYAKVKGWFDQSLMSYDADVHIKNLNLHHFMPNDSLFGLSADVLVKGHGTDFFKSSCWLEADAQLHHFQFNTLSFDNIKAKALLRDGHALASVNGDNRMFYGNVNVDALLNTDKLQATFGINLPRVDLRAMQLNHDSLTLGLCGHLDVNSDLNQTHLVSGLISEIYISDSLNMFRPQDIGITARTNPDTTLLRLQSGNFVLKADASGGYQKLMEQATMLSDSIADQYKKKVINQSNIKALLPTARFYVTCGRENPIAYFLRTSSNTTFKELLVNLTTSPTKGINGESHIFSLNADSTRIDTIRFILKDSDKGLTFQGDVTNNKRNPQFVFHAHADGIVHEHGASVGVRFYDDHQKLGLRIGATADMVDEGIRLHLLPSRPTLGYKEFNLNSDNYLLLRNDSKLEAKVDLIADDGTGVKVYSENQDSTLLQDLTVSVYRFDLEKITSVLPYMLPQVSGMINGDYHLMMNHKKQISVASDMTINNLVYEHSPIGDLGTEFVYLQREDDTHAVEGILTLNRREIGTMSGEYRNEGAGYLNASIQMERLPMMIANGFVPDQLVGLEGYADGVIKIKGALNKPVVDGSLNLDSAYLISKPYSMRLRFDNVPVQITKSRLLLNNFAMYAYNNNPLTMTGNIDFHDLDHMSMDMRMRAENFQLINSKQTKESVAYGKAWVNFFARMNGYLNQLKMRGRLDVLGSTDVTYIMLDSPISTGNQVEELVKFTDFNDSTQTIVSKPTPQGLDVDMTINIDQGTHVRCDLNADQTNYVDILGGGDLRMRYTNDGITLNGRYTVSSGSMKYSLPVIPLKTFTIQDGSYVEFSGEMMNPRLNLTATERTKATVGAEGTNQTRSVAFDCGVVITQTLNNMGLEFIIDAPEDATISSELNAMTTEQRGKLAVTMLTTGMYLADGNTGGFSMNSALNSFLQSEINNITGSALKTLDVSVGMDKTTNASGTSRTDYSFKFAKRFWNNRLMVQIGGKVSTGNDVQAGGEKQSFFDNVAMEYRLTPTSNQYAKMFYNQNVYDWLEGYTGEYGVGYIWRRKLSSIWDIFKLWGNDTQDIPAATRTPAVRDSMRTEKATPRDSMKVENRRDETK